MTNKMRHEFSVNYQNNYILTGQKTDEIDSRLRDFLNENGFAPEGMMLAWSTYSKAGVDATVQIKKEDSYSPDRYELAVHIVGRDDAVTKLRDQMEENIEGLTLE
jgi:hypothetical protein